MAATGGSGSASAEAVREMYAKYAAEFPDVPTIPCTEVAELMKASTSGVVLVDTRTPEEREVSVLRGAVCSDTFDTSAAAVERLRGTKVVCYCTAGLRSARVARTLRQAGLDAYNLEGSILGWTHHGLPLVEPASGRETRRVHTYGPQWSMQAEGYEAVTFKRPLLKAAGSMCSVQ